MYAPPSIIGKLIPNSDQTLESNSRLYGEPPIYPGSATAVYIIGNCANVSFGKKLSTFGFFFDFLHHHFKVKA